MRNSGRGMDEEQWTRNGRGTVDEEWMRNSGRGTVDEVVAGDACLC